MENLIMALSPLASTLMIIAALIILTAGFIFLIIKNYKKSKKDKYMRIKDKPTLNALLSLIDYRIKNSKNEIHFTLLLVSIDDFDRLGELFGQSGSQYFLEKEIEILRKTLPVGAKMAQTAEKETFLIYLPEIYSDEDLEKVATVFKTNVESKVMINGTVPMEKTASIAITTYPSHGDNVVKLINNLLSGLYSIKKTGGNKIVLYTEEMDGVENNAERYKDIKQAIDIGNMKIRFNPMMNPEREILCGVESIINRINDNGTTTEYGRLLAYLEETDDDFWFTTWGVEKALLSNIDIIRSSSVRDFIVTIKAGYKFMTNSDSAYKLQSSLERYDISAQNAVLELDDILDNKMGNRYVKSLLQIQGAGIRIIANITKADKDLNRLIEVYDVDMVKLNVKDVIANNSYVQSLLKAAYNYRKKVIVTGVETREQADRLKNKHISYIQGPLYGLALTKEQIKNMVEI